MGLLKFFQSGKVFKGQEKPDSKKNFFQNYSDHLDALEEKFKKKGAELMMMNMNDGFAFVTDQALERLKLFESLRDGHDYFDEVVGATAIPLMGLVVAAAAAGAAIWEGAQDLAIYGGFMKPTEKASLDENLQTSHYTMVAVTAFVFALASFLKSAISLISRPVVTAIHGFDKQDEIRFNNNNSLMGNG